MYLRIIVILFLAFISQDSFAQSRKQKKKEAEAEQLPNSLDPTFPKQEYAPKASRKSSKGATYEREEQYYQRMADLQKTKKKNERMLEKPSAECPSDRDPDTATSPRRGRRDLSYSLWLL